MKFHGGESWNYGSPRSESTLDALPRRASQPLGETHSQVDEAANFHASKRKLRWRQNGGEKGVEIDDVHLAAKMATS